MERGLYIHIPFCKRKCLYCDFCSFSGSENLMMDYSMSLAKEICDIGECKIKTIFIGGGTPTYLSCEAWEIIGKSVKNLNKSRELEFTVEGNPGTLSYEKLKFLKSLGVNRLSIGLQAVQNDLLKRLGRIHTYEEFLEGYNMARAMGFKNINVDLMFGLPNQSLDDWKDTLNTIVKLNPEHISAYSLIIEEGTEFYQSFNEGRLLLPSEDEERDMYRFTLDYLKSKGYEHYEISNFSKPGKESRHNLLYWDLDEYIGCGAGAHSYVDGKRYSNENSIDKYINRAVNHADIHLNTLHDTMEEFMFMGLRKIEGISINKFNKKFKSNIFEVYGDVINKYLKTGLMSRDGDKIKLTDRGIEISNSVMCEFMF